MSQPFQLHPVPRIPPDAFLRLAQAAQLHLRLPFPRQRFRLGMIEREWFGARVLDVELTIRAGLIERGTARSRIEPELSLPLGMGVRGLRLNGGGDFVLEISGLGEVNLNRLVPLLPRIPGDPVELWLGLEPRLPRTTDGGRRKTVADAATHDAGAGLELRVEDLTPFPQARLDLGPAGFLILSEQTRIDLVLRGKDLEVEGHLVLEDGQLSGPNLELSGLSGSASVTWKKRGESLLEISDLDLGLRSFQMTGPVDVALENGRLEIPAFRSTSNAQNGTFSLSGGFSTRKHGKWRVADGTLSLKGVLSHRSGEGLVVESVYLTAGEPDDA
ncbi:MAG: hypothetical protein ACFB9M_04450 [Myxococcota bacterium]